MLSFSKSKKSSFDAQINNLKSLLNEATSHGASNAQRIATADRSLAVVEFDLDGRILHANENFLRSMGYSLDELVGQNDKLFARAGKVADADLDAVWGRVRRGETVTAEICRVTKTGKRVSFQSTYGPMRDESGRTIGVMFFGIDTTERTAAVSELQSKNDLVEKTFAVIQFTPDGIITYANQNFLSTVGYSIEEIRGKHHSMFVDSDYKNSNEYREFWNVLRSGRFHSGEFRRVGRNGKEIYIQASYNPIFGLDGEISSIVKFATNITEAVHNRTRSSEVAKSVSSSVAEMTQTIQEISNNVASTTSLAKDAESLSGDARRGVQDLDERSRTIGKVVETIRELAEQTNLLALNATIESARAGEAGRGFAVVASEVKELAKQTSKATQSIEQTVRLIQDSISEVVSSTENISNSVASVSQNMVIISAAVEEQSVTMRSLADTAQELQR